MRAIRDGDPDAGLVAAAQRGDRDALDALVAQYLPLLYNIVGRALNGHADTDDVVQETMFRAVRGIGDLRDPAAFRSWLVAVAVRQVRDHTTSRRMHLAGDDAPDVADPGADFVDLTILRMGLSGQRRETAEATRWLDEDDQELLALWWQEAAGTLDRDEVAAGVGMTPAHTAVRISRMKERLTTARLVVRALRVRPRCGPLAEITAGWDESPSPLWRKRVARHVRDCPRCGGLLADLIPAEHLLNGLPLLPLPVALTMAARALLAGPPPALHPMPPQQARPPAHGQAPPPRHHAARAHGAAHQATAHGAVRAGAAARHLRFLPKALVSLQPKVAVAVIAATACVAGGAVAVAHAATSRPAPARAVAAPRPARPAPPPSPRSVPPPPPSHPPVTHPAAPPPPPPATAGLAKGVGAWSFDGVTAALAQSRASWYYTWGASPNGITSPPGVAFVPMIWGNASVTTSALAQVKQEGRYLLTFNEPDSGAQASMTVAQALADWPALEATGMLLGSPAVQDDAATPGSWLDQFMTGRGRGATGSTLLPCTGTPRALTRSPRSASSGPTWRPSTSAITCRSG